MDPDLYRLVADIYILPLSIEAVLSFIFAATLLFISALISASETAFFSLEPEEIEMIEEENTPTDNIIRKLLEKSDYLLATLLISNCFANIFVIISGTYGLNKIFDFSSNPISGFIIQAVILIFLLLLFGEILPKIYAQQNALKYARFICKPLRWLKKITFPLAMLLVNSTNLIHKSSKKKKHDISVDELSKALELTGGEIRDEKEILEGIIQFYDKTVAQIMTSRIDISALEIHSGFKQVINHVIESGYSRIPIYTGTCDTIKGVLYIKDLLPYIDKPESFRWQTLIRPAFFIPETKKIDDLLEEFRSNKIHLAIVVDEFGGTSGIVTLEDILEEIVGEISDEYDEDDSRFTKLPDGSYIFEAKTLLTDFFKITGIDSKAFEKFTGDVETLAGLILEIKGNFPEKIEIVSFKDYSFQILEISKRRIMKVKFLIKREESIHNQD